MSYRLISFCVAMGLAVVTPKVALAQTDVQPDTHGVSAVEWRYVDLPDSIARVRIPCEENQTLFRTDDVESMMACRSGGLTYMLASGRSNDSDNPLSKDFETNLTEARADADTGEIAVFAISGFRAFRVHGKLGGIINNGVFVELNNGEAIIAIAAEDRRSPVSNSDRDAAWLSSEAFVNSLEVSE